MDGSVQGFFPMLTALCNAFLGISKEFPHREMLLHKVVKLTYKFKPDLANCHGNAPGPANESVEKRLRTMAESLTPAKLSMVVAPFEIKARFAQPVIGFGITNKGKLNNDVWPMCFDVQDIYEQAHRVHQEICRMKFSVEFSHNGKAWKLAALPIMPTVPTFEAFTDLVVHKMSRVKSVSLKLPLSLGVIPAFPSMIEESLSTNSAINQTFQI